MLRHRNIDKARPPFDLRDVVMAYWTYQLPFGKSSGALLNRIAGGWTLSGIHRVHSGGSYRLTGNRNTYNNISDSGVILNVLSVPELQDMMRSFQPRPNLNAISTH